MKHKVRVTVLDKKLYPELQREYWPIPPRARAPVTTSATNLSSIATTSATISGIWG